MPTRPSASVTRSRAASVEDGSLTSGVTGTAGWPVAPMRSLASLTSSMSPRTMRVPRSARPAAMAWPMPWAAPVTSATRPVYRAGRDEVVHRQRAGDEASPAGPGRAAAEHGDSDDAPDAVPLERLGGGPGEAGKGGFDRRRPGVRRRQPHNAVAPGTGLGHNRCV